jgi:hypothetical protein
LTGGQRIFPRILRADLSKTSDRQVVLTLNQIGDFSIYTLTVNLSDTIIDPAFASHKLRFRLACDDPFDCGPVKTDADAPPELAVAIDYLVKDYASFRQALLEFIPTRMPEWTERNEADLGMMLLELFAYTADTLSYMQDRVANEAFLETAGQRRSVAGHLALIGYEMDQGASAYTWLQFKVERAQSLNPSLRVCNKPGRENEQVIVFEPHGDVTLRPEHNEMPVYTGGDVDCCLPSDALSLTLGGNYPYLQTGNHVLLDDGEGQRDIVEITSVSRETDTTLIGWSERTPLRHTYCVRAFRTGTKIGLLRKVIPCNSTICVGITTDWVQFTEVILTVTPNSDIRSDGKKVLLEKLKVDGGVLFLHWTESCGQNVLETLIVQTLPRLVVRGNLAPATHGETIEEEKLLTVPDDRQELPEDDYEKRLSRGLRLSRAPLAYLHPNTPSLPPPIIAPDSLPRRQPRGISTLTVTVDATPWQERPTLLDSGPNAPHFRVEIDDAGDATVRFGKKDSGFGARPQYPAPITARYRVGGGVVGNVSADTLVQIQTLAGTGPLGIQAVTNPVPAIGGRDLESSDHARRFAPATFKKPLVTLTAADYQAAVEGYRDAADTQPIQRARAAFRWTGSWLTALLAVDPFGAAKLPLDQEKDLLAFLDARRLAGYDLEIIDEPNFVAVELAIDICVKPGFRPDDVEREVRALLGETKLFHPDNFSFGQSLYVSRIFDAVAGVPGVSASHITRLCRYRAANFQAQTEANLKQGFLAVGPDEIVRLDNDRNFPENGTVVVKAKGVGR